MQPTRLAKALMRAGYRWPASYSRRTFASQRARTLCNASYAGNNVKVRVF